MKKAAWLTGILILGAVFLGFIGRGDCQTQENQGKQKAGSDIDKNLALKFLQGIQSGDKKKMYEAANLTTDIVNDSREKLVHSKKYNLTEQRRRELEHVLRISGQIDFFIVKMKQMFPKSSSIQVLQSKLDSTSNDIKHTVHLVKITYLKKDEAMRDKTGKSVREMVVHLSQLTRTVDGRLVYGFSFSSKDFEKFADRNFEVLSYF